MNCKPGDIALWKRTGVLVQVNELVKLGTIYPSVDGEVLRRVSSAPEPAWDCELLGSPQNWVSATSGFVQHGGRLFQRQAICDSSLIPIRPQSDDAECESKAWLPPVPVREVA